MRDSLQCRSGAQGIEKDGKAPGPETKGKAVLEERLGSKKSAHETPKSLAGS